MVSGSHWPNGNPTDWDIDAQTWLARHGNKVGNTDIGSTMLPIEGYVHLGAFRGCAFELSSNVDKEAHYGRGSIHHL